VEADCGGVNAHVGEDDIHIIHSTGESEMFRQGKRNVQKNIVMTPVTFPELPVEIMIVILGLRSVNVYQVPTKKTSQNHHACKWGQSGHPLASNDIRQA
jgi:hypothetical protein